MLIMEESKGHIKRFTVGKDANCTTTTHLLFAGDTILFSNHEEVYIDHLFHTIHNFERTSGLKINCQKFEFMGIGIDPHYHIYLADSDRYGSKLNHWPNSYLGLPLNGKQSTIDFWQPIIEKVEKRLSNWGSTHLSKGGHLTLYLMPSPHILSISFQGSLDCHKQIGKTIQNLSMDRGAY